MSIVSNQLVVPLVAGLTGAAGALLGNLLLQRYIARLGLRSEIARRKIKALDESWSAIDDFKVTLDTAIGRVAETRTELRPEDWKEISNMKLGGSCLTTRQKADQAMICIESNRIWFTDAQYDSLLSCHQALIKHLRSHSLGEPHDQEEILKTIKESHDEGVQALRDAIK